MPNRRQVTAGVAAAALVRGSARAAPAKRPNVVFILADDLGYADLSCYGQRGFTTPVLDRLAAQGLKLTSAYANSAVCSATRTALLTGRYQYRLPVGLQEPIANAQVPLLWMPPGHPTLASLLKGLGYRTSLVGKWHLGTYPDHSPRQSGYDYAFGFVGGASDYFTHSGPHKKGAGLWEDDRPVDVPGYLTDIITDRAIRRLQADAASGQPFFMSLHYNAPHWPWEGPGDEARANSLTDNRDYEGGDLTKYGEMVRYLDTSIGKVLAALRQAGAERDTIVIFTSDNGGERFSDVWPFTGMKGELLEGGVRVPAIVRWPASVRAGTTSDQVMASMDWLPTLLKAAGGSPDPAYPSDGQDLLGVLTGAEPVRPRTLFWRYKAAEQAAVRDGNWKYLKLGGREFLFDVVVDQHERANLKAKAPEVFARLKADFAQWNAGMLPYPEGSYSENAKSLGFTRTAIDARRPIPLIGRMDWIFLTIAIAGEILGTSSLKAAQGFTRLGPSLLVVLGYGATFWCLSLALRTIPMGIAYGIWSGVGIVAISLIGWFVYRQRLDPPALVGMALIMAGVLVIQFLSKSTTA